jgi:hypothetical protein
MTTQNLFDIFGNREFSADDFKQNTEGLILNHLWNAAFRSKYHQSFSPEKRANQLIRDYSALLTEDIGQIKAFAKTQEDISRIDEVITRYKQKFEQLLTAYWNSESNCVSSMISGPSNFPVRQQEKRRQWAENKYSEFNEFRDRAKKAIKKSFNPKPTTSLQLDTYIKELAQLERSQELMKEANKIIKSGKNIEAKLIERGFSQYELHKLTTPDFMGRIGYPTFKLSNNLANIKRVKERIAIMQQKEQASNGGNKEYNFEGGKVVVNYEADRIQILYDAIPSQEIRTMLKSNAFNYSHTNKAWQRQITNNSKYAVQKVLNIKMD